jgi:hypothetical protein
VVAVVRGGEAGPTGVHPAASIAANHCISVISASGLFLIYYFVQLEQGRWIREQTCMNPHGFRSDLALLDPDQGARTLNKINEIT